VLQGFDFLHELPAEMPPATPPDTELQLVCAANYTNTFS